MFIISEVDLTRYIKNTDLGCAFCTKINLSASMKITKKPYVKKTCTYRKKNKHNVKHCRRLHLELKTQANDLQKTKYIKPKYNTTEKDTNRISILIDTSLISRKIWRRHELLALEDCELNLNVDLHDNENLECSKVKEYKRALHKILSQ